jgi:ParB-like chromosome segregation protein Spo0J
MRRILPTVKKLSLNKIIACNSSSLLYDTYVEQLARAFRNQDDVPPILVERVNYRKYEICDGHHRYEAARVAGLAVIKVRLVDPLPADYPDSHHRHRDDPRYVSAFLAIPYSKR